jgi:hypothetical protein
MSAYADLLNLVREQVATARGGDLESAIALMGARQLVIDGAPPASPSDTPLIQEVLVLDRELAGFIRERMLRIRNESLSLHRGQTAMRGYGAYRRPRGDRLDAEL